MARLRLRSVAGVAGTPETPADGRRPCGPDRQDAKSARLAYFSIRNAVQRHPLHSHGTDPSRASSLTCSPTGARDKFPRGKLAQELLLSFPSLQANEGRSADAAAA